MENEAIHQQTTHQLNLKSSLLDDIIFKLTGIHLQGTFNPVSEIGKKNLITEFGTLLSSFKELNQTIDHIDQPEEKEQKKLYKAAKFLASQSDTIEKLNTTIQSTDANLENIQFFNEEITAFTHKLDSLLENLLIIDYLEKLVIKPQSAISPIKKTRAGNYETTVYFSVSDEMATLTLSSNLHEHLFEEGYFYDSVVSLEPIKDQSFIAIFNDKDNLETCRFYSIETFIKLNGINPETNQEFQDVYLIKTNKKKFEATRLSSDLTVEKKPKSKKRFAFLGVLSLIICLNLAFIILFAILNYLTIIDEKARQKQLLKKIPVPLTLPPSLKSVTEKNAARPEHHKLILNPEKPAPTIHEKDTIIYSKKVQKTVINHKHFKEVIYMITSTATLFNKSLKLSQAISEDINIIKEYIATKFDPQKPQKTINEHKKLALGFAFIEELAKHHHTLEYQKHFTISDEFIKPITVVQRIQKSIRYFNTLNDTFALLNSKNLKDICQTSNQERYQYILDHHHQISAQKMDQLFTLIESEKHLYSDLFNELSELKEKFTQLGKLIHKQSEFISAFFSLIQNTTNSNSREGP